MWVEFLHSFRRSVNRTWADRRYWANVAWLGVPPPPGTPVQVHEFGGEVRILAADGQMVGRLEVVPNPRWIGLIRAVVSQDAGRIDVSYLRPDDLAATAT
jgi:hypothetical protein